MTIVDRPHAERRHKAVIPVPCMSLTTVGYTYHISKHSRLVVDPTFVPKSSHLLHLQNNPSIYVFATLFGNIAIERDELIWKRSFLLNLSGFLKARPYSAKTFGRGLASSGTYGY
jgi:hypothetical protein